MKKLLSISGVFVIVFFTIAMISCNAQAPKADLKTEVDSLSYALGVDIVHTQGLSPYLTRMGVDSTNMQDFIKGFLESANVKKDDKKTSAHLLGLQVGQQIGTQMYEGINRDFFGEDSTQTISKNNLISAIVSALLDKQLLMTKEDAQTYSTTTGEKIRNESFAKQHAAEKAANAKFLEENKSKEGVETLPNGLQYKVIKAGNGPKATAATDTVKVDYVGTTIDGKEFDSSKKTGKPVEFALNRVIAGWTEGIQLMPVGSKYIFYIPYDLAYGERGDGGRIPPFATLIFEVDLYGVMPAKK